MLFRRIVFYALFVGLLSGLVLTVVQTWQVVPIIKSAEMFEGEDSSHSHDSGVGDHHHGSEPEEEWAPEEGFERTVFTFLSNVMTAIGFALLMIGAIVIASKFKSSDKKQFSWLKGLVWGIAGYLVFWLIPALGLPPEIPLAEAAPLHDRQWWWLFAVICAAVGLAGLAFGESPWRWLSPLIIFIPYLVGAPHPDADMFASQPAASASALELLAQQFIGATAIANALFWVVLGSVSMWSVRRMKFSAN
jgi:cobalt transporter subunit CbtA